jgi:3-ketosteroid 9alpha-monooxygenase subunit A
MTLPSMRPTGWFQVGWSADLDVGDVVPLHYFGRDLVGFRGIDGHAHVLDAHCQHLGANLAFGGCVVEGGIQCPFHGWVWNGTGRNVRIPYEKRPNLGRRIGAYPVAERNESVYIWHDVRGRSPMWEVPDWSDVLGPHVRSPAYHEFGPECRTISKMVSVHPQMVTENGLDTHHFRFVHHTPVSPTVLREDADSWTWSAKVGFGRRWKEGIDRPSDSMNTIELYAAGIGLTFNGEHTRDGIRVISICTTPVDDSRSDIFAGYWIDEEGGEFVKRLAAAKLALPDDITIWDHQQYLSEPGLAPSEDGFGRLRSWANAFYSPDKPPDAEQTASSTQREDRKAHNAIRYIST